MLFTETWITNEHSQAEYSLKGYQEPVICPKARGGTCIFVKEGLNFYQVQPPENMDDSTWIVVCTMNNIRRLYGCIYRSPNSSTENNERLMANLKWADENFKEVICVGDFNYPEITWPAASSVSQTARQFLETFSELGWSQKIEQPTRYRHGQQPSLLDLIMVSNVNLIATTEIATPLGKSDHVCIEFKVKNQFVENIKPLINKFNIQDMNVNLFNQKINEVDWDRIFHTETIDTAFDSLINIVDKILPECAQLNHSRKKNWAPWSSRRIGKLSKKKRIMWDKYKHSGNLLDHMNYRTALDNFNIAKEEAITSYERNVIANKNSNPKRYYRYVASKDKYKDNSMSLLRFDSIETEPKVCASIMNDYFSSVYTVGQSDTRNLPPFSRTYEDMTNVTISEDKVRLKIMNLDENKSVGPDGISAKLIKRAVEAFTPILTKLFKLSYETGRVPKKMKSANVIPIFKNGDKRCPNNYRPVSITPIISKLMESIIKDDIEKHVYQSGLLHTSQHGFNRGKSTSTNLIQFWDDVTNAAERHQSLSIIYTDLRKAFDSVSHDLLLIKLRRYGIDAKTIEWLKNYLQDRSQRVCVAGVASTYQPVRSGVPQGGVLSGIMFAMFINDLPDILKYCKISMYADDAKVYAPIIDNQSIQKVQEDIDSIKKWCDTWRLNLNAAKCHLLQYNPRSNARSFNPQYRIGEPLLDTKSSCRDLGILIADDMKFHHQVDSACKKAYFEIGRIRRSFISRSPKFLSSMYKIYVRPHLEYCVELWNPGYRGDIIKMEKVQNRMTRLLREGRHLNPEERNKRLNITSHEIRRKRGDMINIYKYMNADKIFTLRDNSSIRGNDKAVRLPLFTSDPKRHSFAYRGIREWNSLSNDVVNAPNLNIFKSKIDAYVSSL